MNHQDLYFTISIGVSFLLVVLVHNLWLFNRRLSKENELMADYIAKIYSSFDEERAARNAAQAEMLAHPPDRPTSHEVSIDHQTFLLIHLAANNSNEDEARSAAMLACMRIQQINRFLLPAAS